MLIQHTRVNIEIIVSKYFLCIVTCYLCIGENRLDETYTNLLYIDKFISTLINLSVYKIYKYKSSNQIDYRYCD